MASRGSRHGPARIDRLPSLAISVSLDVMRGEQPHAGRWWMALAMTMMGPLPNVVEQIREAVAADLPDEQINSIANKRRQLVMVSIIPIVGAYGLLVNLPYPGTIKAVAVGYVLFSTLCELRPDLSAEFAKELQ